MLSHCAAMGAIAWPPSSSAHPRLRILKRPQHTDTVTGRTTHNEYVHKLMAASAQIEPPRIPPLRELDRVQHRTTKLTTPQRDIPSQTHRASMFPDTVQYHTMHNRRKACCTEKTVHGGAYTVSSGTREDRMQRGHRT